MRRVLVACAIVCETILWAQPALAAAGDLHVQTATVEAPSVVDVSTLAPSSLLTPGALPQLRPASPTGAAATLPAVAESPQLAGVKPVASLSTILANPLRASNNPFALDPPDQAVAAGAGTVVQMVNVVGRVWVGTTPGPTFALSSFFGTGGNFISDPWVFFDQASGRFFAGIFDVTLGGEVIAVSRTSDPNGTWFVNHIPWPGTGGNCPDQGKIGISDNIVALGANLFSNCSATGTFSGAIFEAFSKAQMLSGSPLSINFVNPSPALFSVVPAISQTSTTTQFFAGVNLGNGNTLHLVTANGTPPNATFAQASFAIPAYSNPPEGRQKGTGTLVDTGDTRVQRVAWQAGHLGFSFNESCVPSRDTVARACARFVDFRTATDTLSFSKTVGKRGKYLFNGAPVFNSAGQLVSPVSLTSASVFPTLDALALSTTGQPSSLIVVRNGAGPQTSGRYGDYNAAAIEPSAPTSFWAAGEVGLAAGDGAWSSAVALVTVS
jgi:hypothetical protein